MKLSGLLLLFVTLSAAAFTGIAQNAAAPGPAFRAPTIDSGSTTLLLPLGASSGVQKIPPAQLQGQLKNMLTQMGAGSQQFCPVVLTRASLTPHLMLTRDGVDQGTAGGLDLEYRNTSGKAIWSMDLSVHILARKSIYDPGAAEIAVKLTAYGSRSEDAVAELRHLALPQGIHPAMVSSVVLQQVVFEDGSVWTAQSNNSCGYSPNAAQQIESR